MKSNKKLGIIGGMGSRASSLLLTKLIDACPAQKDQEFVEVVLHNNSKVPDRTRAIIYNEESPLNYMLESVDLMNYSKVDYILIACVTAHYYYEQLQQHATAEILHPAEAAVEHYLSNYERDKPLGILCTTGTLRGQVFQNACKQQGVNLITLDVEEQERLFMASVYMQHGLKSGFICKEAMDLFRQSVSRLADHGAEVFIGGCSEVQVGLEKTMVELPCIDAFDALVEKSIGLCYNQYEHV